MYVWRVRWRRVGGSLRGVIEREKVVVRKVRMWRVREAGDFVKRRGRGFGLALWWRLGGCEFVVGLGESRAAYKMNL